MNPTTAKLSLVDFLDRYLNQYLAANPDVGNVWVAVSGGADSCALLHALACCLEHRRSEPSSTESANASPGVAATSPQLCAIHVNHGLHPDASRWAALVARHCQHLGVPLTVENIAVANQGEGVESAARSARYGVFQRLLNSGDVLLTAHHQDDQAETLLLRLMRGSGLRGLAAMPALRPLGDGRLLRPLLAWRHDALRDYCQANQLEYVDDPANHDPRHRRSVIRHQVLPLLQQYWPDGVNQLAESARFLREQEDWLAGEEALWLRRHTQHGQGLKVDDLAQQPAFRQLRLLQQWLRCWHAPPVPAQRAAEFLRQVQLADVDRLPLLAWRRWRIGQYQRALYLLAPSFSEQQAPDSDLPWQPDRSFDHPWFGRLEVCRANGLDGVADVAVDLGVDLRICWRRGGETLEVEGGHHQTVKSILQHRRVAPWLRSRVPLIYRGDQLWAVGHLRLHPQCSEVMAQAGLQLRWTPPPTVDTPVGAAGTWMS